MNLNNTIMDINGLKKQLNDFTSEAWEIISECNLSEDFIREFQDKIDWNNISRYHTLSEDFIREFQDKVI